MSTEKQKAARNKVFTDHKRMFTELNCVHYCAIGGHLWYHSPPALPNKLPNCEQHRSFSMIRRLTPAKKYHFMIGTTSRVPKAPGWHYLILDVDQKELPDNLYQFLHSVRFEIQKTKNGWHVYTDHVMRLRAMIGKALTFGADKTWAKLALGRGWAFLADKKRVKIPWAVERKIIAWREPSDSNRSKGRSSHGIAGRSTN